MPFQKWRFACFRIHPRPRTPPAERRRVPPQQTLESVTQAFGVAWYPSPQTSVHRVRTSTTDHHREAALRVAARMMRWHRIGGCFRSGSPVSRVVSPPPVPSKYFVEDTRRRLITAKRANHESKHSFCFDVFLLLSLFDIVMYIMVIDGTVNGRSRRPPSYNYPQL